MDFPKSSFPSRLAFVAFCVGVVVCLFSLFMGEAFAADEINASHSLNNLWESAAQSYAQGVFPAAKTGFTEWISQASQEAKQSPEAYYNLALTEWQLKQPGPAVFHLLKSTTLRLSPVRVWEDVISLSDLQKKIGVKENVADEWFFRFALLFNSNLRILLCAIAFWSLCAGMCLLWLGVASPSKESRRSWGLPLTRGLFVLSGSLSLVVAIAYFNKQYYCNFAVLNGPSDTISVFRSTGNHQGKDKEDVLSDYPSGTIVNVLREADEGKEIDAPIAGWIPDENVQMVD